MKRLRLWLALLFASICSLQGAYALDIKEPVMPLDFAKFDVNETYYLYNVRSKELMNSNIKPSLNGCKWNLIGSNGSYYLKTVETNTIYSLYRSSSYKYTSFSTSNHSNFNLNCVDAENNYYTFSYYSSPDSLYLGFTEGDTLYHKLSIEDDVVWAFLPEAPHSRYLALKNFHELLGQYDKVKYNFLDYETKYMEFYDNPNSTADEINLVVDELRRAINYANISATSEVPIWVSSDMGWSYNSTDGYLYYKVPANSSANLSFIVNCDEITELYFIPYANTNNTNYCTGLKIYVDDKLYHSYYKSQLLYFENATIYVHLDKGKHKIDLVCNNSESAGRTMRFDKIYAEKCPEISVNLLEPGSLGTEVLYHVNHLKDVRNLKIKGAMNEDDWNKIDMMENINILDLSEADVEVIPESQFDGSTISKFILPNKLKTISDYAFRYCRDEELVIPESVKTIGVRAFSWNRLRNLNIPNVTTLGEGAFYRNIFTDIKLSDSLIDIPKRCFNDCSYLKTINGGKYFPKSVNTIGDYAFEYCDNLNVRLHHGVTSLGYGAFSQTNIDSLFIPEGTSISSSLVYLCDNLVYAELPTSFYKCGVFDVFSSCTKLNTLVLKSPTVVGGNAYTGILDGVTKSKVTLRVPDYLVNAYKLDEYWYDFNIEGFSTEEVKDWKIQKDLTLYARDRFKGNPNLVLTVPGGLNILGETGMEINNLIVNTNYNNTGVGSRFISHNDGVKINGSLRLSYYTSVKKWYFISLPFDIKVSEIVPATGMKYAIRYYDGANRAQNGTGGNWKNYEADDIIEAGTGFIYQTSQDGWTDFYPMDDESKQNIASNKMFVKALEANPSEKNSNKGWNLVGNPWQAYFNNHSVNFTAPITVWNGSTYVAYSLIDDDYAIKPNEAFFVQCPEEINSISFPITGRQMTSEITNQSGAKPRMFGANLENRQLIDLSVAKGDLMDKTRVVVNEGASADYETGVDASKFFSMDGTVSQVYTLVGEATECAINERPVAEGLVKVGFMAPEEGSYTFALVRNEAKTVMLIDHETGTTTDLTAGEYNFTAAQGTWNNRFELLITPAEPTAIEGVDGNKDTKVAATGEGIVVEGTEGHVVVYSVDGKKVAEQPVDGTATISVAKGTYLVRTAKGTAKVTVR